MIPINTNPYQTPSKQTLEIAERLRTGTETYRTLAIEYGISHQRVGRIARQHGISRRRASQIAKRYEVEQTPIDIVTQTNSEDQPENRKSS